MTDPFEEFAGSQDWVPGLPVAGWLSGDRDAAAVHDCLRARFVLGRKR